MSKSKKLALSVAMLMFATSANALTIDFSDRASFLAAGGAATDHISPVVSARTGAATVGGLEISPVTSNFFSFANSPSGISNALIFSAGNGENFNIAINEDVFGFGFDIFEPTSSGELFCNTTCVASTFEVTFLDGATSVGSETFTPTPSNTETTFFGVISTLAFNGVEIRETVGSNDNEHFGNFTTVAAPAPVPLPAPFALLLAGLGALAFLKKRKAA